MKRLSMLFTLCLLILAVTVCHTDAEEFHSRVIREASGIEIPEEEDEYYLKFREDIEKDQVIVPYTLSTDEMLNMPEMKGTGAFDGLYKGSIRHVRDNIVEVDLYEYVVYHYEDIQNLLYGDRLVFEDQIFHVNTTLFEHEEEKSGNVTIALDGDERLHSGEASLYLMDQFSGMDIADYCVDYSLYDLAYRTYVRTLEVALGEEIEVITDSTDTKWYTDAEFIERLKQGDFGSIYNDITIYNDALWVVQVDTALEKAMTTEVNKVAPADMAGVITPIYSIETIQELSGQSAAGAVVNYRGCIRNVEGNKVTLYLYKTDFYSVQDLRNVQSGDSILIDGKEVQIATRKDIDPKYRVEVLLEANGNPYNFRPVFWSFEDYCLVDYDSQFDPMVSYSQTIEVELAPSMMQCGYSEYGENSYHLSVMTFDEIWQYLQAHPEKNDPAKTNITMMYGKLFGYTFSDGYDKYGVRPAAEMTGWN